MNQIAINGSMSRQTIQADELLIRRFFELLNYEFYLLRGIGPDGTIGGYFDDRDALVRAAVDLNGAKNVYIVLNPVRTPADTIPLNELIQGFQGGSEQDILERRFFPIDIDSERPSGTAATNLEVEKAQEVSDPLIGELGLTLSVTPPPYLIGTSGNGIHILIPTIAYAPTSDITERFCLLGRYFARKYDTQYGKVDPSVYNINRLWRVPGTLNLKGDNSNERPYRLASMNIPQTPPVLVDLLSIFKAQIDEQRRYEEDIEKALGNRENPQEWQEGLTGDLRSLDVVKLFHVAGLYISPLPQKRVHRIVCPWSDQHSTGHNGDGSTVVFEPGSGGKGWPGFKCFHAHCAGRTMKDVVQFFSAKLVNQHCSQQYKGSGSFEKRKKIAPANMAEQFLFFKIYFERRHDA